MMHGQKNIKFFKVGLKVCSFLLQNFLLNRISWNLKKKTPVKIEKKIK
jgi:hypothetical protein